MHKQPGTHQSMSHIYLSADFRRRREVKLLVDRFERLGYKVWSKWHMDLIAPSREVAAEIAIRNIEAIQRSDMFIVIGPSMGRKVMFELGIARAAGLRIIYAGVNEIIHMYDALPTDVFNTIEELIQNVKSLDVFRYKKLSRFDPFDFDPDNDAMDSI